MVTFAATSKSTFSVPVEGADQTVDGSYKKGLRFVRDAYGGSSLSGGSHAVATIEQMTAAGSTAYGLVINAPTGATANYALYTTGDLSIGNVKTGTWQGTVVSPTYGGTGVNNGSNTLTLAGNLTTSGAFALQFTTTAATTATLPSGTVTLADISSTQTFTNKTWNGGVITGAYGGTGVANTGKTITLGGNVTTSGAYDVTLTLTASTNVTLPSSGTLATRDGAETLTNKTLTTPTISSILTNGGAATITLPTSTGTLATLAGTETLTNKTINVSANTLQIPYTGGGGSTVAITGVTDNNAILATKYYVDAVKVGLDVKDSVRVATTTNITLSGTQTIDGVAVVANDRVLVKNQATDSQNGIYVVAAGAWSRASDFNSATNITPGAFAFVEEGTTNDNSGWVLTTNGTVTVGTTSLTFTQFSGAGQITAGTGISITGNTVAIDSTVATLTGTQNLTNKTYNGLTVSSSNGTLTIANGSTLATSGAYALTFTATAATNVTLPTTGTLATLAGTETLTNKTLGSGSAWNGSVITGAYGGTGVNNGSSTITLGGNLTTSGAFALTLTQTAATNVTLPTTGTLATLAGSETFTNKTLGSGSTWNGNVITGAYGGTGVNNGSNTITLGGNLTTSGGNALTLTTTGTTNVTLPTSGTLLSDATGLGFVLGSNTSGVAVPPATSQYRKLGFYMLWTQTTDATTKRLTSDGLTVSSSNIIKMPQGTTYGATWFCKIYVTAHNTSVSSGIGAAWEISAVFRKNKTAGGISLVGDPMVLASAETGMTNCSVSISEDTANEAINLSVTGLASSTINWAATMTTTEIGS